MEETGRVLQKELEAEGAHQERKITEAEEVWATSKLRLASVKLVN